MANVIFTHHAQQRLKERRITQKMATKAIEKPDRQFEQAEPQGSVKFVKTIDGRVVHIVATYLQQEQAWLVISVWVRGEEDSRPLEETLILSPFKLLWFVGKMIGKIFLLAALGPRKKK